MSKANTRVIDLPEQTQPTGEEVTYIATENEDLKISLAGIRNFNAKIFSQKSANLSDLEDKEASRINLGVYSREQINANNTARDKKISDIETINALQNTEIEGIKNKNTEQDARLESIENLNDSQNVEIGKIKDINTAQSEKIGQLEIKNTEIGGKVTRIETELAEKIDASDVENNYANKTHNHTTSEISDYNTATYNIIKNKIIAGQNVTITEEDEKLKITATGGGNGGGGGDMLRSIYDKDNDGKVDVAKSAEKANTADSVDWNNIQNKPTTFPAATHTHTIANITGLENALNNKSPIGHLHPISEITGLQNALNNKADTTHNHEISDVLGLNSKLTEMTLNINKKADKALENTFLETQIMNKSLRLVGNDGIHWWGSNLSFYKNDTDLGTHKGWYIGGRTDYNEGLLFEYNYGGGARQPMFIKPNGVFSTLLLTDIAQTRLTIGTRYALSNIAHDVTQGHITQVLWGDMEKDPEGNQNDGGWGLEFGRHNAPYLKMIMNDVYIGRNDGYTYNHSAQSTHYGKIFAHARTENGVNANISLAIGDSDTGFNWVHDGRFDVFCNNERVAEFGTRGVFSHKPQAQDGNALVRKDYVDGNFRKIVWKSESLNGTGNIWLHHGLNITEQEFFEGKYDFIAYFQSGNERKVIDGSYDDTSGGNKWLRWSGDVGAYMANTMVVGVNHLYINNGNLGTLRRVIIYKNY